ncbi:Mutator mutT protein [Coxiella burnetii str. Namibia]|nr:Mutator mutT protein [Coxiella burnetii str. Namibia]
MPLWQRKEIQAMSRKIKLVSVAVGIIINPQNEVLVSLRPKQAIQGNLWEFPGGKIEVFEDSYQALCRELKEEVDLTVIAAEAIMKVQHCYDDYEVTLEAWRVIKFKGEARGLEGQRIRWMPIENISELPFLEANQVIINYLQQDIITQ